MGFFNKFLKGLGFEDDDTQNQEITAKKKKKEKVKNNSMYASFDLNEPEQKKEDKKEEEIENINVSEQKVLQTDSAFSIIKVKSQVEVQNVVEKIKNSERVLINLSGMSGADITRSLDFLTGAVFALDREMQKVDGNVYLIQ